MADTIVTPYLLLAVALVADGLIKQLLNFSQLSYVPLVAALLVFVAWGLSRPQQAKPTGSVVMVVSLLLAWSVVELFNPQGLFRIGAGPTAFQRYLPLICLWLAPNLLGREAALRTFLRALSLLALLTAAVGIYQYLLGPDAVSAWGPGFSPFRAGNPWYSAVSQTLVLRPESVFSAPALAAEYCLVSLIASGWLLFDSSRLWRVIAVAAMAASASFVAIGGVRTITIQMGVFLVLLAILTVRSRRVLIPAVIGVVALSAMYVVVPAVSERLGGIPDLLLVYRQEYRSPAEAYYLMSAAPLGTGFGTSWDATANGGNIENYYVVLASDLGFPGPILFAALIGLVAMWSFQTFRRSNAPAGRFLSAGVGIYSLSLFLVLNTGLGLDKPTVAWLYWTLAGLMVAAPSLATGPQKVGARA